jgi:L-lactate dehydrogenase complex protein LldG
MTSREKILQAVRQGKPEPLPLPGESSFASSYPDFSHQFGTVLDAIGGDFVSVSSAAEIADYLALHFDLSLPFVSLVEEVAVGNVFPAAMDDPHQFSDLYLVLLRAQLGVAENGAVWVTEQDARLRVLSFIPLHLAVVLREEELVGNMHAAYSRLSFATGHGTFIAGPSKTADIEQSLVIGAHGPKTMTVFLLRE